MATARERLGGGRAQRPRAAADHITDPDQLLEDTFKPRGWSRMTREERLDWIADRLLADSRAGSGVTSHRTLRETGILSPHQLDRRRRREVNSSYLTHGGLDQEGVQLTPGVFGRAYPGEATSDGRLTKTGKRGGEQSRRPWDDFKDDPRGHRTGT